MLNAAGIVVGGAAGLAKRTPLPAKVQNGFKIGLGIVAGVCGLWLAWASLKGPPLREAKELGVAVLALIAGRITGRLLLFQKTSNRLGQFARRRVEAAKPGSPGQLPDAFLVCSALFCAAPLGILGAIQDGLSGYFAPLALKGLMDGLAAMGFVSLFGWGVMLSAVPVLVLQGTIALLCARFLQPWLLARGLIDPMNAVGGLLVFCVALMILEIRKIEVTDYLPSLCFAPLFAWWLR